MAALSIVNAALKAVEEESEVLRRKAGERRGVMASAGHRVDQALGWVGGLATSALGL